MTMGRPLAILAVWWASKPVGLNRRVGAPKLAFKRVRGPGPVDPSGISIHGSGGLQLVGFADHGRPRAAGDPGRGNRCMNSPRRRRAAWFSGNPPGQQPLLCGVAPKPSLIFFSLEQVEAGPEHSNPSKGSRGCCLRNCRNELAQSRQRSSRAGSRPKAAYAPTGLPGATGLGVQRQASPMEAGTTNQH